MHVLSRCLSDDMIKIRNAAAVDFNDVLRLGWSTYPERESNPKFGDYVFLKRPTRKRMREWFSKLLADARNGNAVYLVAEIDGAVVGQCFIRRGLPKSELSHVGSLSILVHKDYRGRGVGKTLLGAAIKAARGNFETLHLTVFSYNRMAKEMYKKAGFASFGVAPGFVKRDGKYIDLEHMYIHIKRL